MCKRYPNNHLVIDLLILIHLFLVLSIHSCFPLPSYNLRTEGGVISQELIKSLKQGETTREDLLLLLGEPDERGRQDRYFIYNWIVSEGAEFVDASKPNFDILVIHYFCVEFNEDNRIKRLKHINSGFFDPTGFGNAMEEKNKWIYEVE